MGARTLIGEGAWIGPHVHIGDDCVIGPGAVIGSTGFGYTRQADGSWKPKPHVCSVVVDDDVYIGANTCVDRGSWRHTTVRCGARIDNLVHVAHNVYIDRNAIVVARAMLAGSVEVGEGAWIGPSASIHQRLTIGERALVGMGAVVLKDVDADTTVAGVPARVIDAERGVREEM